MPGAITKKCTKCKATYTTDYARSKLCKPCWIKEQEQIHYDEGYAVGKRDGFDSGRLLGLMEGKSLSKIILTKEEIIILLKAVHPDVNPPERRAICTAATQIVNTKIRAA